MPIASISSLLLVCAILSICLPLVSFVTSILIKEQYSWVVTFLAPLLLLISSLSAAIVFYNIWGSNPVSLSISWFSMGGTTLNATVILDNLSALMLLVVNVVSCLVHFYSAGYMADDTDIRRYFAMLGFFTFSMLGIVVAGNLLVVFVFWELVGFSSYMLIGHWNELPAAANAAKRSFIINRVGDAGFLVGLMIVWSQTTTFDIQTLNQLSNAPWQTAAALCIFCGVIGKSAQFPLFIWLPPAMQGPTPVSALIHAATMVAAGVFLLMRIFPLFTDSALTVVIITGSITALIGALAALSQTDIKKILAYSTISQLGLMVVSVGAGAPEAAMLHLFTHAFFKACLFLAAGSIIHALHQAQHQSGLDFDVQDIRNLGGIRRKMPFTFLVFLISGAALSGVPLFSGFLSKDAILSALVDWRTGSTLHWVILLNAFLVTFVTAMYVFRMIWCVFMGNENLTRSLSVNEPPAIMRAPMAILALLSVWLVVSINPLEFRGWLYDGLSTGHQSHHAMIAITSAVWVLIAIGTAYLFRNRMTKPGPFFQAFYIEQSVRVLIETPAHYLAVATAHADRKWLDGLLHSAAYGHLIVAHFTGWIDRTVVDGTINNIARMSKALGSITRSFQRGKIQLYVFWALFATIIFIIWNLL